MGGLTSGLIPGSSLLQGEKQKQPVASTQRQKPEAEVAADSDAAADLREERRAERKPGLFAERAGSGRKSLLGQ